jgi:anti-sigma-K factor RskA
MSRRAWPTAFVVLGALLQPAIWLAVRPDLCGPQWTDGHALEIWLVLEGVVAVVLGLLAPGRRELVTAVLAGWALQVVHFALFGAHYDDTLWGVGLVVQALCAAVAVGLASLAARLSRRG